MSSNVERSGLIILLSMTLVSLIIRVLGFALVFLDQSLDKIRSTSSLHKPPESAKATDSSS